MCYVQFDIVKDHYIFNPNLKVRFAQLIFLVYEGSMNAIIKIISTEMAPKAIGPYSQGIVLSAGSPLVFVSGQLPIDPKTGKLIEGEIDLLTERTLENVMEILLTARSSLEKVLRVEIFCTDLKKDFLSINAVYGKYFVGQIKPARQTLQVSALPLGSPIEISCIAYV